MQNEILINVSRGETRVALLEKDALVELLIEREDDRSVVGNIIRGRVTRVLPGMQAAFVDIGLDKAAFLYAGDYVPASGNGADDSQRPRRRGRNGPRAVPKIDTVLSEGQEIVVQVAKEPIGTKGARITSHLAIAGRHLVLTPAGSRVGVSRRIDTDRERRRLREIVTGARPEGLGFIIRTAGEGARREDLEADIRYLSSVWERISANREQARAPHVLYHEPSLPLRVVRDVANPDTKRIVVDCEDLYGEIRDFVERFVADPKPEVSHYRESEALFERYEVEPAIDANLGRKVWLKSGGYLIIDQSEALTAIDVNTGRYVGKRDLEETVLKTNLEAVKEVVHQLRFRNIGGLIIIDLIDMENAANREKVYRALQDAIRADKAKTNILKISELGLVEMTRKRTRENLVQQLCEPCSYCDGRGYVLSRESVTFKVLRDIRKDLALLSGRQVAISVHPRVAEMLLGPLRNALHELEQELGRELEIRARPGMHQEQFEVLALDAGPPVELSVPWLAELPTATEDAVDEDDDEEEEDATEPDLVESDEPEPAPPSAPLLKDPAPDAPDPSAEFAEPVDATGQFRILPRPTESEDG